MAKYPIAKEYVPRVPSVPFVMLYYHIFKNAGSTVEYGFGRALGERFATLHGPDVASFLLANPEITAISSHHLEISKAGRARDPRVRSLPAQEPLNRLWSMYKHFLRSDPAGALSTKAKGMQRKQFFDFLLEDHPHLVNDVMVNVLANGGDYTRPQDSRDCAEALKITRGVSVLGVIELFDENLVPANYFLRPAFPTSRLDYVGQNVSPEGFRLREEVGDAIYWRLQEVNRLDRKLVSWARGEVCPRFKLIPARRQGRSCFANVAAARTRNVTALDASTLRE
ncbi:MAG: hypothetical protein C5B58_14480 [Acidobacteria bacterium]|nr:MAG: hypothetical protein C5B58_14480 [Acidobacteriota bacterium]